jgi:hypothetical protein
MAGRDRKILLAGASLLLAGWVVILMVNRWHVTAPVVFLGIGWFALILCGRAFFWAAQAASTEGNERESAGFELSSGREVELEREKRALLKAIKEVEFDREMGKMSEADALEITRVYRGRAIEVLKELEEVAEGNHVSEAVSIDKEIEREVRARLAVAGVAARKKPGKASDEGAAAATDAPRDESAEAGADPVEASLDAAAETDEDAAPEPEAEKREEA